MDRAPGLSVRLKLTLSYAGFVMLAGALLLTAVWVFLPAIRSGGRPSSPTAGPSFFRPAVAPSSAISGQPQRSCWRVSLCSVLLGGWLLAGRMLNPLGRASPTPRAPASSGSLSHPIRLPGRNDEFRELADAFDAMLARLEAQVAEQQRFAANASHQLRPRWRSRKHFSRSPETTRIVGNDELVDRLLFVNTRAIELTEALLILSHADQRSFSPENVDLSLIAEEATEALLPLAGNARCHHRVGPRNYHHRF